MRRLVHGKPSGNEQGIVRAILTFLTYRGIPHAHIRNSGRIGHGPQGIFYMKDDLSQPGIADILACYKGRAVAIEVKSATGRVRPEQVEWLKKWQKSGGVAIVARSVDAVEQFLDRMPLSGPYQYDVENIF